MSQKTEKKIKTRGSSWYLSDKSSMLKLINRLKQEMLYVCRQRGSNDPNSPDSQSSLCSDMPPSGYCDCFVTSSVGAHGSSPHGQISQGRGRIDFRSNLLSFMLICPLMNKRKYRMTGQQEQWPPLKSQVSKLVVLAESQQKMLVFSWGNRLICNSLNSIDLAPHENIPFWGPSKKHFFFNS